MPWYCYKPGGYNTMWLSNPSSQDTQTNLKAASETRCRRGSNRPVDPDRTACHLVPPRHSNITVKKYRRPTIVAIGLFGAALIHGDGAITPALSVLSAPEGLNIATPALKPHVLSCSSGIIAHQRIRDSTLCPVQISGSGSARRVPLSGENYLGRFSETYNRLRCSG